MRICYLCYVWNMISQVILCEEHKKPTYLNIISSAVFRSRKWSLTLMSCCHKFMCIYDLHHVWITSRPLGISGIMFYHQTLWLNMSSPVQTPWYKYLNNNAWKAEENPHYASVIASSLCPHILISNSFTKGEFRHDRRVHVQDRPRVVYAYFSFVFKFPRYLKDLEGSAEIHLYDSFHVETAVRDVPHKFLA
jgi:hypothetical protein